MHAGAHIVWVVVAMRLISGGMWQPVQMGSYDSKADCEAAAQAMNHAAGVKAGLSATCHQMQPPR